MDYQHEMVYFGEQSREFYVHIYNYENKYENILNQIKSLIFSLNLRTILCKIKCKIILYYKLILALFSRFSFNPLSGLIVIAGNIISKVAQIILLL